MIDMAFRNIWQRKTRSALTILGVGLAVVLYVYLSTIMSFYDRDLDRTIAAFAGKVIVQARTDEPPRFPPTGSLVSMSDVDAVLSLPEVDRARSSAILIEPLVANPAPNMPPSVMAVGITPGHEFAFRGNAKTDGAERVVNPNDIILGASAATRYGVVTGDTLTIKGRELRVVGVIGDDTEMVNNAVLMPLETAWDLFARSEVASAVVLTAASADQAQMLAARVEESSRGLTASTSVEMARAANKLLGPQRAFFASVRGTIIAVGIVVVMVVMVMAVGERRREIGTLKALGASRRQVLVLVLSESVALSLIGALGATVVAWLLTRNDSMSVDVALALQTIVIAVLVGTLAALWPAWSAHRVDPIESLRYE
jgi:putative ABC transport system permease protein